MIPIDEKAVMRIKEGQKRMNLNEAIELQELELVKQILIENPSCIEDKDNEGTLMSFVAASTGNLDIVKYIVEYSRASMNVVDDKNRNILHYAAMSGNPKLAKYLVERVGMSVVSPDVDLVTPFDIAHEMRHTELEKYFEEVCKASLNGMYRNPIRSGMYPDPSIVRVGEDYYMVNSSFIFFPCIPISHSRDLVHWRMIGHAITNPDWAYLNELEAGRGYWAPDISYYEGRYYITATYRLNDTGTIYRRQMVVSSDQPEGPYSKPVFIEEDGIDPSIFSDDDGRRYMLLNRGARILELNKEATEQISEARLLYYGDQKRAPEGPHLLKKDGFYYLFLAEGGTGEGHRISVARSKTLYDNYEPCPYNPIMRQVDEKAGIQRCGHGKPVQTQKGEWYMVYLCGRRIGDGYSILGRETALDPIKWTEDGWPIVNNLAGPSALQRKPDLPECVWESTDCDDFDLEQLGYEWMFPRPPEAEGYRILESKLWLRGSKAPLSSREARNIVLRRQKHFVFTAETKMGLTAMKTGQDAGITCYYDENTWLKFGVFAQSDGTMELRVVEHIGILNREAAGSVNLSANTVSVYLRIKTHYLRRNFYYSYDGKSYQPFVVLEQVNYLCDEGLTMGKRFTGAMVGMYAYGGNEELLVPFEFFNYEGEEIIQERSREGTKYIGTILEIERKETMNKTQQYIDYSLANFKNRKYSTVNWNYEDGCVLMGCVQLYQATGDKCYQEFVLEYLENFIREDGSIANYEKDKFNIDSINSGKVLFYAYEWTGVEKYQKAIDVLMEQVKNQPRTKCNNFWHKKLYPNQIWLDGLYMAQPFYMMYETRLGKKENYVDIINQFKNVRTYLYDDKKGLYYHAYDESKELFWADKVTGKSPNFWLRSMGWYLMALVDVMSEMDEAIFEHYKALEELLQEAVRGVLQYQEPKSKLFYQVIDRADVKENYLETSGSAMIGYAIIKGCRLGALLKEKYLAVGEEIIDSLTKLMLIEEEGIWKLSRICSVAGLGPADDLRRDGSIEYYLSEPVVCDDQKGMGAYMMAYAQKLMLSK